MMDFLAVAIQLKLGFWQLLLAAFLAGSFIIIRRIIRHIYK